MYDALRRHCMSIIVRRKGSREYAYAARRDGTRMVQTYIGPLARPDVRRRVEAARWATMMPAHTMRLFPAVGSGVLHLQRDSGIIVACLLEHGDLADLRWLTCAYPASSVVDVLLSARDLSDRVRNFWTVWFEVPDAS
jgi:hypothetical protein